LTAKTYQHQHRGTQPLKRAAILNSNDTLHELTRDDDLFPVIVAHTVTPNYDAPGSFFGEGHWIVDLDSVTDDAGNPIELTEDEEQT
jgi:hypothetical protein